MKKGLLKEKIKYIIKTVLLFLLNPRLLLCFLVAWIITNGWSYILTGLGLLLDIKWMVLVGGGYLTFLWLPISPEKIVTVAISLFLLRWWFPNDEKTLGKLREMYEKIKIKAKKTQKKKKDRDARSNDADPVSQASEERKGKGEEDKNNLSN